MQACRHRHRRCPLDHYEVAYEVRIAGSGDKGGVRSHGLSNQHHGTVDCGSVDHGGNIVLEGVRDKSFGIWVLRP